MNPLALWLDLMASAAAGAMYLPPPPPVVDLPPGAYGVFNPTDPPRYVAHNGSLMLVYVNKDEDKVWITYAQPRPGLQAIGVVPGTLLVEGQWRQGAFSGISHLYTPQCGPMPYRVSGTVDQASGALILEGGVPRVWGGTCAVADYVWSPTNSHLEFTRVDGQ